MSVQQFTSPRGTLEWVNIRGEGKEDLQGNMRFVANLVVEADSPVIKQIEDFWAKNKPAHIKEPKSLGFRPHEVKTDETDENGKPVYEPTGKVSLSFWTGTTYKDGKVKEVPVANAKGVVQKVTDNIIGNGSVGRVKGAMSIYQVKNKAGKALQAGVTLYLNGLQVSKLVEYQAVSFEAEEDGEDGWSGTDADWDTASDAVAEQSEAKSDAEPRL